MTVWATAVDPDVKATHARWDEFDLEGVGSTIQITKLFLREHFGGWPARPPSTVTVLAGSIGAGDAKRLPVHPYPHLPPDIEICLDSAKVGSSSKARGTIDNCAAKVSVHTRAIKEVGSAQIGSHKPSVRQIGATEAGFPKSDPAQVGVAEVDLRYPPNFGRTITMDDVGEIRANKFDDRVCISRVGDEVRAVEELKYLALTLPVESADHRDCIGAGNLSDLALWLRSTQARFQE